MPPVDDGFRALFDAEYKRRRGKAVEETLLWVGGELFGFAIDAVTPSQVMVRIEERHSELGWFTIEGKQFQQRVAECEKRHGERYAYHPAFAEAFLRALSSVKRWDALMYFNDLCHRFSLDDSIDYLYLIDVLEEGLEGESWQRAPLEKVYEWLKEATPSKIEQERKHIIHETGTTFQSDDSLELQVGHETTEVPTSSLWEGLLVNYKEADLRRLLISLELIDHNGQPTTHSRARKWMGVIAALRTAKPARLVLTDDAALYRALLSLTRPHRVISERALQDGYNEANTDSREFYSRTLAFLGA